MKLLLFDLVTVLFGSIMQIMHTDILAGLVQSVFTFRNFQFLLFSTFHHKLTFNVRSTFGASKFMSLCVWISMGVSLMTFVYRHMKIEKSRQGHVWHEYEDMCASRQWLAMVKCRSSRCQRLLWKLFLGVSGLLPSLEPFITLMISVLHQKIWKDCLQNSG